MTTTLERSLSRASSMSVPLSSPRLSFRREITPPAISDTALIHICDRLNQLEARVCDLRASVLTKDGYVDRRNREDEYIRREFETHRVVAGRIDVNVAVLRTDIDQLKLGLNQIKSNSTHLATDTGFLRADVDRLQKTVKQVQTDLEHLQTDVGGCRLEIGKLHTAISQLRTELITLQHDTTRRFSSVFDRFSGIETRLSYMDRVRFNSLAYTIHAPITPVPVISEDGSLRYPDYFPKTVWRFWCLKKKSRVHRLVELAEFYELGGYQDWSQMHEGRGALDSSDSSDSDNDGPQLTRAEATRRFPEACHQALAATIGLVYYKIRKEVGEGPNASGFARPAKRMPDEMAASVMSNPKQKPAKVARIHQTTSSAILQYPITGPSLESKSVVSEDLDRLGWNVNAPSEQSDETMSKFKGVFSSDIHLILRAVERGRLTLKPSRSEQLNLSPTESKGETSKLAATNTSTAEASLRDEEQLSPAPTVATEIIHPVTNREPEASIVESG